MTTLKIPRTQYTYLKKLKFSSAFSPRTSHHSPLWKQGSVYIKFNSNHNFHSTFKDPFGFKFKRFFHASVNNKALFTGSVVSLINVGSRISLLFIPFAYSFQLFRKFPKTIATIVGLPLLLLGGLVSSSFDYSYYGNRYRLLFTDEKHEIDENARDFEKVKKTLPVNYDTITSELFALIKIIVFQIFKVTGEVDNRDLLKQSWNLLVTDDPSIQAQVLASGHIIINTGTLQFVESVDELAFILAHEISHILYRHNAEMKTVCDLTNNFLFVAAGIIDVLITVFPSLKDILGPTLSRTAEGSLFVGHNRLQEFEADKAGLLLMARAHYNPTHAPKLWRRLAAKLRAEALTQNLDSPAVESSLRNTKAQNCKVRENLKKIGRDELNTHPDALARAERLEELLPYALEVYNEAKVDAKKYLFTNDSRDWLPLYKDPRWATT